MRKREFKENLLAVEGIMKSAKSANSETQSAVAQYACVSLNGYIEEYLQKSMIEKYRPRCDQHSLRMITKIVERYYNFKSERVQAYILDLWPTKTGDVKMFFQENDQFRDAIGSIVGNKNKVGHTGGCDVTISRVQGWLTAIKDLVDEFDAACFS